MDCQGIYAFLPVIFGKNGQVGEIGRRMKIYGKLRKSTENYGNLRKTTENRKLLIIRKSDSCYILTVLVFMNY